MATKLMDPTLMQDPQDVADFLTNVLESSTEYSIIGKDLDGLILLWNEGAHRIYGYEPEEVIGKVNAEILHAPEDVKAGLPRAMLDTALAEGKWEGTLKRVRRDRQQFTARVVVTPRRDLSGEPIGFLLISRNISDELRLTEELQATQFYTRSLIESNIDALMTTDLLGVITDVNQQMEALTGRAREELVGTRFAGYFTDPGHAEDGIKLVLREGRVTNYELTAVGKDGRETVVSYNAATFYDRDGKLQGVFAAARDVTEQKELEAQLQRQNEELEVQYQRVQEANRQKSEFLANMSHELRTPLNGAIGFTQLVHEGKAGPISTQQQEYLGFVLTSTRHLLQLINDILDLAKVESGKVDFHPELVDLERVTGEVISVVRELAANKRLQLGVEVDPSIGKPITDAARLKQVLYNYVSNAIKFTPDGGSGAVRVLREDADFFRLEVEDSGIGIKPEDMSRLFVEFQQLDASAGKKYAGTGLGLALTKRIVEAQGGSVGVRSVPGQGSVFFAVLPRRLSPAARSAAPSSGVASLTGSVGRILIVEDNPADQQFLLETLEQAGYSAEVVPSCAEAIRHLQRERVDAVLLDLLLPDGPGLDVLQAIRTDGPNRDTPVIIISVVPDLALAAAFPVQCVLTKPVGAEDLRAALAGAGVAPRHGQRVLVVDDDPAALALAELALQEAGYVPICCLDGESGLAAAAAEKPGALILDLLMPGMDGFAFLQRLRQTASGKRLPVLVWTSKLLTDQETEQLRASTQAVVTKGDGSTNAVVDTLAEVLGGRASPRSAAPRQPRTNAVGAGSGR